MKYSLMILLAWAVAGFAQEGPYVVMESDSAIHHIHVAARNDSVADVFYQIGNDAYHAAFALDLGLVYSGPSAFFPPDEGYTRSLEDAIMTNDGWITMVQDESPYWGINTIIYGSDSIETEQEISAIGHIENIVQASGSNWKARLHRAFDAGFYTTWVANRIFWNQLYWEAFSYPDIRYYSAIGDSVAPSTACFCWNWTCWADWVFTLPVTQDSSLAILGDSYTINLSAICEQPEFQGWGKMYYTATAPLAVMRITDDQFLLLSARGSNYDGPFPARIVQFDTSGQITEHLQIEDNPLAAAATPNFGFAWTSQPSSGLMLNRADTSGAITQAAGVVYWPETDSRIVENNLDMTDNGKIVLVWSEQPADEQTPMQLKIAAVDWETPLSATPSDFIPQPSSLILSAYPNPFNALTTISFTLPQTGDVSLRVFDITGRLAQTLVKDERMNAGNQHIVLDANELPSGIYLCQLRLDNMSIVEKLVLIR